MIPDDPRLRIVLAFAVVACLSQLTRLPVAFAALAGAALIARASGQPLRHRLLHLEGFVALLFVMLPFTMPGTALFHLGPLTASREGLAQAGLLGCKVSAAALVLLALLAPIEPARLGAALHALRLPDPLVRLFTLTPRYLALFRDEARRLSEAMRARGFRPGTDRHTWRSYGNLIGMLLVRALARARRVEEAMSCRGFSGRIPHAPLARPAPRDWTGSAAIAGLALAAVMADRL